MQRSPRWLQKIVALDVEGRRAEALGDAAHLGRRDEEEDRAAGSTKRRISQGQAMRSIFGRDRVTQSVAPSASRGGMRSSGTSGSPAARQAAWPPSRISAPAPGAAQPGRDALAPGVTLGAEDDRRPAGEGRRPVGDGLRRPAARAGNQPRVGGGVLVGPHVDQDRRVGPAEQAEKLIGRKSVRS